MNLQQYVIGIPRLLSVSSTLGSPASANVAMIMKLSKISLPNNFRIESTMNCLHEKYRIIAELLINATAFNESIQQQLLSVKNDLI